MSTHAIRWPADALSSVADAVLTTARQPVLLVRREAPAGLHRWPMMLPQGPLEGRLRLASALAGGAIALRFASDWLFATGGPLWYEALQAAVLAVALLALGGRLDLVFLKGGATRRAVSAGAISLPLGLLLGTAYTWSVLGAPRLPSLDVAFAILGSNLFFPAVEELEFRGFLLAWALGMKIPGGWAVACVAVLHVLAHPHWIWQGNLVMVGLALLLFVWLGYLTLATRSLWGAYVGHAGWNIGAFLTASAAGVWR